MGRVGACADNAAMESFFALLQKNVFNWKKWATRDELRLASVTWIESTSSGSVPNVSGIWRKDHKDPIFLQSWYLSLIRTMARKSVSSWWSQGRSSVSRSPLESV
jgi:transposase InsO family protein